MQAKEFEQKALMRRSSGYDVTALYRHIKPERLKNIVEQVPALPFFSQHYTELFNALQSNLCLRYQNPHFYWARQDSNLRPMDYESTALPLSYGPD